MSKTITIKPEWIRAIAKASSSLRFTADQWDWITPAAREESHSIADLLDEIEAEYFTTCSHSDTYITMDMGEHVNICRDCRKNLDI